MKKINNPLGMSALISHPERKTIEEQIKIFAVVGFESFFLSSGVTDQFEKIPFWSQCAENNGIIFEAVHAPSNNVDSVWKGTEESKIYKENTEKIIDYCSNGGISKVVLHTGTNPDLRPTQRGLEFWHNLERYAKERSVKLCYENANAPTIFEAVVNSSDKFHGVCHDIGHQLCYTPQKNYAEMFREKLLYTHVHDNMGDGRDLHFLPKDGINDWEVYFLQLKKVGYKGTVNLELSCYYSEAYREMSFEKFAEFSYKRIKTLISD